MDVEQQYYPNPAMLMAAQQQQHPPPPPPKIPITLITGFLGAGKTTLLNHILSQAKPHGYTFAIIENEFGAIPVDDQLLLGGKENRSVFIEEHLEVVNGCVCCNVRGDLMEALERLYQKFIIQGSSMAPPFDAIIIETTGLADPAPVVQTFFIEPSMQEKFSLDAILTVVDAQQILTRLDEQKPDGIKNEAEQQVLFADRILLNKIDLVSPQELGRVHSRLSKLHPTAHIVPCHSRSLPPPDHLIGLEAFNLDRICEDLIPDFLEDDFLEFNEKHDKMVSSVACTFEGDIDMMKFDKWIGKLTHDMKERLYRFKGVLAIADNEEKFVFQGVGMLFHGDFSPYMRWEPGKPRKSAFVFIGKDLNKKFLVEGFDRCKQQIVPTNLPVQFQLRFPIGHVVLCNVGNGRWEEGTIVDHWLNGTHPYRIHMHNMPGDKYVAAPMDVNAVVRDISSDSNYMDRWTHPPHNE